MTTVNVKVTNCVGEISKTVEVEFRDLVPVEPLIQIAVGALTAVLSDSPQKSVVQPSPSTLELMAEMKVLGDVVYMLGGVKKRLNGGPLTPPGVADLSESLDRCMNTLQAADDICKAYR